MDIEEVYLRRRAAINAQRKKRYQTDPEFRERSRKASLECKKRRDARRRAARDEAAGPKPEACPLCRRSNVRLVWDHCHAQGHFRGWICDNCNRTLGFVADDPGTLRRMAEYIERDRISAAQRM